MKVVCINNGEVDGAQDEHVNLTIGKAYEVLGDNVSISDHSFAIINDYGNKRFYHHKRFESIEYTRDKKLKKLGIL
jgi:hypothetical protein